MENSFFSGSENIYKYLVTIGILMIAMTVYYPLREKQNLEIEEIKLNCKIESLALKIQENKKNIKIIEFKKKKKIDIKNEFLEIKKLHLENLISQIESKSSFELIKSKQKYINYYNIIFWIFFPFGTFSIVFGFINWLKSKRIDDEITSLEKTKLELEINKLKKSEV
jgi:hypothetical protein